MNKAADNILVTTDAGKVWTSQDLPIAGNKLYDVSCPTTTTCYLAGGRTVVSTTNGGANWNSSSIPGGTYGIGVISCPAEETCFGGDTVVSGNYFLGTISQTTDGGSTWTSELPGSGLAARKRCLPICFHLLLTDPGRHTRSELRQD